MTDDPEIPDVHAFIAYRLEEDGLDPKTEPEAAHNAVVTACSDYIVSADHTTVQDYEYHYITAVRIADQIYASQRTYVTETGHMVAEADDIPVEDDAIMDFADRTGRYIIGNTITLIYSMAHELVNDLLGELLVDQLQDSVPESGKNAVRSQLDSYHGRADTLAACDVITTEQGKVIRHIADVRNALVHNVEERFTLGVIEELNEINRLPHLINDLYEQVYDTSAFRYYDDLTPEDLIEDD